MISEHCAPGATYCTEVDRTHKVNMNYITVSTDECEPKYELELEDDGKINIECLRNHFGSHAVGLKFVNPETQGWHLVNCKEGKICPPRCGWLKEAVYYVCMGHEQHEESFENGSSGYVNSTNNSTSKPVAIGMKQLRQLKAKSFVAQNAYANWITLNTVVRNHVHSVKWYGKGAMMESQGTSKEEAFQNQILRQDIMSQNDVQQLLQTYTISEGFVRLDKRVVSQHVRAVINEMKKAKNKGIHDKCFGKRISSSVSSVCDESSFSAAQHEQRSERTSTSSGESSTIDDSSMNKTISDSDSPVVTPCNRKRKAPSKDKRETPKSKSSCMQERRVVVPSSYKYSSQKKYTNHDDQALTPKGGLLKIRKPIKLVEKDVISGVLDESSVLSSSDDSEDSDSNDNYEQDDLETMSSYERERQNNILKNKQLMTSLNLTESNHLNPKDAITVAKAYFPVYMINGLTAKSVKEAMKHEGINPSRDKSLSGLLQVFGKELLQTKKVVVHKHENLTRKDVKIL